VVALCAAACSKNSTEKQSMGEAQTPPGMRQAKTVPAGGVVPPAAQFKNPKPDTPEAAAAGGNLFASMNCDGCHGGGAPGWVGPSLIDGRWRYGGSDVEIFSSIYYGRPKGMPAYGGVTGEEGVWMLVSYLKSQPRPSVVPTTSYDEMDRDAAATAPPEATPAATPATASAAPKTPEQMLAQYGCTACHAVDRKVIGPAFKEVAAKYKGSPDAVGALETKVRNGGAGVWGTIPMPPNPQVPTKDLHQLVEWALAQK
jgi:cytochrome c